MAVEIVEARKGTRSCGDCNTALDASATSCSCGSSNIKKSIVLVRKATGDDDDDLPDLSTLEVDEDEEVEEEVEEEEDDEEDENEEDEEVDEEEDEDDDDGEEEPEVVKSLSPESLRLVSIEAMGLGTTLAEKIVKAFSGSPEEIEKNYEEAMTELNSVMDAAAEQWIKGSPVSKADAVESQATLIKQRVHSLIAKDGEMPKKVERPAALDGLELPEDVKNYITALETTEVGKRDEEEDIFKGLTPAAAEIVRKAAETNERAEQEKYLNIAKGLKYVPGDRDELAKSLRTAAEKSPEAYETLKKSLEATNELLSESDVFKSYGLPGGGEPSDAISKRQSEAKVLVEKGEYPTIEQAEVALMDGSAYKSTVSN